MKYEKAKDILPASLLREVQKYAQGKLLYVPLMDDKKNWGEASGYRQKLLKRNHMIYNKYSHGISISELADEYFLSIDAIKKVIYSKKKADILHYAPTLASAKSYSEAGLSEEWIHSYLLFTRKNMDLLEELNVSNCYYFGIIKLPLRLIREDYNSSIMSSIPLPEDEINLYESPPLIIQFRNKKFIVNEDVSLFLTLKTKRLNSYPVYIWIKDIVDYRFFMDNYSRSLIYY